MRGYELHFVLGIHFVDGLCREQDLARLRNTFRADLHNLCAKHGKGVGLLKGGKAQAVCDISALKLHLLEIKAIFLAMQEALGQVRNLFFGAKHTPLALNNDHHKLKLLVTLLLQPEHVGWILDEQPLCPHGATIETR